jgi:NADPH2:quinone reductase
VMEISSGDVIFKQATVKGFWGSVVSKTMPADKRRALFGELVTRILDGSLTLPVEATYSFDEARAAADANAVAGRSGKILLRP